jgi:hypothetical protein
MKKLYFYSITRGLNNIIAENSHFYQISINLSPEGQFMKTLSMF